MLPTIVALGIDLSKLLSANKSRATSIDLASKMVIHQAYNAPCFNEITDRDQNLQIIRGN